MKTVLPREQAVEDIFSKILASPEASRRLREVFYQYLDDEHMLVDEDPDHFLQVWSGMNTPMQMAKIPPL